MNIFNGDPILKLISKINIVITKKNLNHYLKYLILILLINLFPSKIKFLDFRSSTENALVIEQVHSSPVWAAYEESVKDYFAEKKSEDLFIDSLEAGDLLVSGTKSNHSELFKNSNSKTLLNGMILSSNDIQKKSVTYIDTKKKDSLNDLNLAKLNREEIIEELSKQYEEMTLNENLSLADASKKLVDEELSKIKKSEVESDKIIPTKAGGYIRVSKADNKEENKSDNNRLGERRMSQNTRSTQGQINQSSLEGPEVIAKNIILKGPIVMIGGLAYVPSQMSLKIEHVDSYGNFLSEGVIFSERAEYEINLNSLEGKVFVKLMNLNSEVIGQGELEVSSLEYTPRIDATINQKQIVIKPMLNGAVVKVLSAYSMGTQISYNVSGAKVNIFGLDRTITTDSVGIANEMDLKNNSNYFASVEKSGFVKTLFHGVAGKLEEVIIYPNKLIDSLVGIISKDKWEYENLKNAPIVWGRISFNGKEISGAEVEVAGETNAKIVYLNEAFIPIQGLDQTSNIGNFVILGLEEGIHSVRVKWNNHIYPAKIVVTQNKSVTNLNIELNYLKKANFEKAGLIKSSFNDLNEKIYRYGLEEWFSSTPDGFDLYKSNDSNLEMIEVSNELNQQYRILFGGLVSNIKIPNLDQTDIDRIKLENKINQDPNTGVVVGLLTDSSEEVYLRTSDFENSTIVYFDKNGKVLRSGHDGDLNPAGFIIYNVTPGLSFINLVIKSSGKLSIFPVITEVNQYSLIPTYMN